MAWLQILVFCCCCCFLMNFSSSQGVRPEPCVNAGCFQTDTIFQGQLLRVGEKLESSNKEFSPIPYESGNLTVDGEGKLKLIHGSETYLVLSSYNVSVKNASATLLDNGNFVLSELRADGSVNKTIWQSFDYPTDTLLPGMKLGRNIRTGQTWSLTSWTSEDEPAPGSFTVGIDTNGRTDKLAIWWKENVHWSSGPWRNDTFSNVPRISHYDYVNLSFVTTEEERYWIYSVNENQTLSRYTIDPFGLIKERGAAGPFGVCFYKPSAGCVTEETSTCLTNESWFERRPNSVTGNRFKFESTQMSLFDCKRECENNCSCSAFASISATGTGCQIWSNVSILNNVSTQNQDVFILETVKDLNPATDGRTPAGPSAISLPPALSPEPSSNSMPRSSKRTSIKWWIWLIAAIGFTISVGLSTLCYLLHGKGKAKAAALLLLNQRTDRAQKIDKKMNHEVQLYSFESLAIATDQFSPGKKLGEGGFGPVYKGELPDGQEVAIKRLSTSSGQGLLEFKNEILLIAKLQHTNLVRLLGCCTQGDERILVYEYMHNKSLDFFLFDNDKKELLNWTTRFRIIEGVAQGLLYLHKYSRLTVIHRDLKSSNILLDGDMNPKISDFGMARIFGRQESEANTKRIVGTRGYMSPEYALRGIVSTKTDVFSFGVLLLEIVSGKKNNSCYDSEHPLNLIGLAWELWKEERALELIDATLVESCSRNEVMRCIHVGLLCVQDYAKDRPSMSSVVSMLTNDTKQPPPQRPGFFIERGDQQAEILEGQKYSINGLSISELKAR